MTILVGKFPLPTLPGTNPNLQGLYFTTTTVRIAGVKGYVTHWGRKEIWGDDAYFTKHGMTVVMMSSSWPQVPSTEQFIDLGNALTGL
ncbi:MAG TPA: hypothetical protein VMI11_00450 [Actinomycetes bacterium]|nr:hypothetical protein [Actinomycetes bacterium]